VKHFRTAGPPSLPIPNSLEDGRGCGFADRLCLIPSSKREVPHPILALFLAPALPEPGPVL
jgi:hypothetical protein